MKTESQIKETIKNSPEYWHHD